MTSVGSGFSSVPIMEIGHARSSSFTLPILMELLDSKLLHCSRKTFCSFPATIVQYKRTGSFFFPLGTVCLIRAFQIQVGNFKFPSLFAWYSVHSMLNNEGQLMEVYSACVPQKLELFVNTSASFQRKGLGCGIHLTTPKYCLLQETSLGFSCNQSPYSISISKP